MATGFAYASRFGATVPAPASPPVAPVRINFAVGHNDPNLIPADALAEVAARVIRENGPALAIYNLGQSSLGYLGLREFVRDKVGRSRGIATTPDNVLVTSGSLQGIDLVNQLMLDAGDHVVVEAFTYGAVFARLRRLGVTWSGAPLDADGIDVDGLAGHLRRPEAARHRAEIPLHDPDDPEPDRHGDAAGAAAPPAGGVPRVRRHGVRGRVLHGRDVGRARAAGALCARPLRR